MICNTYTIICSWRRSQHAFFKAFARSLNRIFIIYFIIDILNLLISVLELKISDKSFEQKVEIDRRDCHHFDNSI